ncbi:hypothetical protein EJ03DRAFT_98083 [Teratosphaeria nubilosa]|uniref:NTF2 domain-containing protein n=1 Tax=Teratosphaeria nubilosa TaxID=161662 RepID=A0A6G1L9M6_9PEZI|nr:hypothetical protein EJ03DRAFT_98083 [Teratosphaeria nubilosa]
MATLTDTDLTALSTSAAESFADAYYTALNSNRSAISSFYVPPTVLPNNRSLPHIAYNGEHITDPAAFQQKWENEMPYTFFDPQCLNVHVLNPCIAPLEPGAKKADAEWNVSLSVQVSGSVRLVERKEGPMRGFSDSFILVPGGKEDKGKRGPRWVVQSQTFRFVV